MHKHVVRAANGVLGYYVGAAVLPLGVIVMDALASLEDRRRTLFDESQGIINAADESGVDLSDEQLARCDEITAELEKLDKQISARKALAPQGAGRRSASEPAAQSRNGLPARIAPEPRVTDRRNGFKSFGEFAAQVHRANTGATPDNRLLNAATTYGNEGTGADGGFLVPPEYAKEIMVKVLEEENLLDRAAQLETGSNNMTIPKDETTPWQSSGGIQVYWEAEGNVGRQSKPVFETDTIKLQKLFAIVPISEELMQDSVGLDSWLRAKAPAKMAAKINTSFVRGTGVGQPLGMMNSASAVTISKESGQAADTVYFANINNMWGRMYAPWRRNAVWLINQDIEPQLEALAFDPTATSKVPVYLPPGGVSASPYATLKGRPVVPIEACSTLGDKGDIILVDMKQYWAIKKSGGIQTDTSIHLYFDQALTAYRFIFRLNGMPAWSAPITPENGNNSRSWCVTVEDR